MSRPACLFAVSLCLLSLALAGCGGGSGGDGDGGEMDGDVGDAGGGDGSMDGGADDGSAGDGSTDEDAGPGDGGTGDGGTDRECLDREVCDNGLDDDCDGEVEEDCACAPGEVAPCFSGDPRHRSVGTCADGMMVCEDSFEFGTWGPCEGDVTADVEVCDVGGLDEDCDGAPNDGCECVEGDPDIACGTSEGVCEQGVQRCVDGMRTDCEGAVAPSPETCDGTDQDCDGTVDEGLTRSCGSGVGACRPGTESCTDGAWGACEGGNPESDEACDGLDNDCDGSVDEGLTRSCGSDTGACVSGTETCTDGAFGACEGEVEPATETCNGADDDCDGTVDEGLTRSCGSDTGACVSGTETCTDGSWGSCEGETTAGTETCDGSVDEDCDGTVDEGCTCTSGETRSCGTDTGECTSGTQTCDSSGSWGTCEGDVGPTAESCNGLDDDCDGEVDEIGCDCLDGDTRSCGTDVGVCETGTETCTDGSWGVCEGSVDPDSETCNSADDDCDGSVDEGDVCPKFPPDVTCPGDMSATVGDTLTLGGSGSDPDGGSVTFMWSVSTAPTGSSATPSPADSASTSFTPDTDGDYTLRLCVTDDEGETSCCTTGITAAPSCTLPATPTIETCPTSWDRRPVVEFDPVPTGIDYELQISGAGSPYATVTTDGQNYHRPSSELSAGAPPPGESIDIFVRACRESDPSCCAVSDPVTVNLVEECTTPVAPTADNIVFSEYVINGDGSCSGADCEAGEAIEITNLSHCPVALDGNHFEYCNASCSSGSYRWMDWGTEDVIPPRGVYVAIRNHDGSMCSYPFFGADDPGLFGLKISTLEMQGPSLSSGWFVNSSGGRLRVATGAWTGDIDGGTTLELIDPYSTAAGECESIGFDAFDACGNVSSVSEPTTVLSPNQLGRLWHPCDAVVSPVPDTCM